MQKLVLVFKLCADFKLIRKITTIISYNLVA